MATLPQATRRWDGGVVLRFPYAPTLITRIKDAIPSDQRSWQPDLKVWTVEPAYASLAIGLLKQQFPDAIVEGEFRTPPRPEPIRSSDEFYRRLHLLPSAPVELIEASYRCLARLHHPDRLPAPERARGNEAMVALNEAFEKLRDRASA